MKQSGDSNIARECPGGVVVREWKLSPQGMRVKKQIVVLVTARHLRISVFYCIEVEARHHMERESHTAREIEKRMNLELGCV